MSESTERKRATEAETEPDDTTPSPDEGADGLGYTARPTEHEPEGDKSPGGGSGDATRK